MAAESAQTYWDAFYSSNPRVQTLRSESPFARWTNEQLGSVDRVLDFGCGTGRDSIYFANAGYAVTGFDFSSAALQVARHERDASGVSASFVFLDLRDSAAALSTVRHLEARNENLACYARFLLHAIGDTERRVLFAIVRSLLAGGGSLFLEFRTPADATTGHVFGETHFRNYLDPETVCEELEELGAEISVCQQGRGLARFNGEDPAVCRVVASWNAPSSSQPGTLHP